MASRNACAWTMSAAVHGRDLGSTGPREFYESGRRPYALLLRLTVALVSNV